ncbi:hypothetical protein AJ80_06659 [Polytolypa hystricis UAMH7299]|uniref:Uncharacterized protein n=1 Tax=Polytolypa hystricis (strain UAMH7299) TaxID=1447883 RepID=A0A2B7XUZ8_POLH7|nr:hypothetical protein AJ80_06659 [Polytolypa hystricis UAMH7299]
MDFKSHCSQKSPNGEFIIKKSPDQQLRLHKFLDALKTFLHAAHPPELEALAMRLKPYRIEDFQLQGPAGSTSMPMLVLDRQRLDNSPTPPTESYLNFSSISSPMSPEELLSCATMRSDPMSPHTPLIVDEANEHMFGSELVGTSEEPGFFEAALESLNYDSRTDIFATSAYTCTQHSWSPSVSDIAALQSFSPTQNYTIHQDSKPLNIPTHITHTPPTTAPTSIPPSPSHPSHNALLVSRCCIRTDYFDFLTANLPSWISNGLWQPLASPFLKRRSSSYGFLENIYSYVSQIDTRIEYDQIRKRVALVLLHSQYLESCREWKAREASKRKGLMGVGRGDMTVMIDSILQETNPRWAEYDTRKRSQLRVLFHDRKRYGKRWSVFRSELGPGILLVCSPRLANMVGNTKVTMSLLKEISQAIRACDDMMRILRVLDPLAESLIQNEGYQHHQAGWILEQLDAMQINILDEKGGG